MVTIRTHKGPLSYDTKWFAARPAPLDACRLVHYVQSQCHRVMVGFRRESFPTLIVHLDADEDELLAGCERGTRYEVKRAAREGATFEHATDWSGFVTFYNVFAARKGLPTLSKTGFVGGESVTISKVTQGAATMVMHSHVLDHGIGRARLLHSASLLHDLKESSARAVVGRANRFLHVQDMLHFKSLGFRVYDFGGYAGGASTDLFAINRFKKSFGGHLLTETNYTSTPLWLLRRLGAALVARRQERAVISVRLA